MYLEDITLKNRFFYEMTNLDTWEVVKNYPERQIYCKREPGLDLITVFYKIKLNTNIVYPFALLSEIQMMKNWVPGVKKSDIFKVNSQFRKAIHVHREMPFPISDRDFNVCHTSLLAKERKGVMVMIRSATEERSKYWGLADVLPPIDPKVVRAEIIKAFMYVEHIDAKSCWFHGYMNMNPKIQFMPDSFVGYVIKKIVNVMVKKLQREQIFEDKAILERMAERKEYYDIIKSELIKMGAEVPE